ncbi:hypothetical protein D9615_006140 [Tricholomella constricta]|uniref:Uncharacterized protein n=1 Tax=Tricholomella constricta TaxID=117010 RepID=A0A8H5HBA1_9AGAR|nr:hypothetical protein D9615_006140 [Tricholomella constricta]
MATQYSHQSHYPQGWAPPYQGAAPPMPAGVIANAQQWQMGSWQFNPAYNVQRYPAPHIQWMPGRAWGQPFGQLQQQQQQQVANFNPYKKVIKPPSAEYLATRLTDNGLDLHNMVPISNPYGDEEDENVPKTPWIWNPATLSNDAPSVSAQRAAIAADVSDRSQNRHSSEPPMPDSSLMATPRPRHATDPDDWSSHRRDVTSSSSSSSTVHSAASSQTNLSSSTLADQEGFTAYRELKPTFSPKIIRTPNHYHSRSSSSSTSSSREQSQGSVDSLSGRMDRMNTSDVSSSSHNPAALTRHSSMPAIYSNPNQQVPSISGATLVDEPASILSPLIIPAITPRPSSTRTLGRGSTYPDINAQPALGTIAENPPPTEQTPRRKSSQRKSPSDICTRSASPSRGSFRNPPSHRTDSYPRSASPSRDASRQRSGSQHTLSNTHAQEAPPRSSIQQHTPPDAYPARQPPSPQGTTRRPIDIYAAPSPAPRRSQSYSQHSTSTSVRYASPARRPPSRESSPPHATNPHYTPPRDANTNPGASTSNHSSSYTYPHNPLPEPPRQYTPPRAANHPAPPTSPRTYEEPRPDPIKLVNKYTPMPPPPGAMKRWRRVGYWNRRGDHCTKEGYIVYAPPDKTYPDDLKDYPEDGVGYENGFGHIGLFDPKRPELPESLPRHGQPPVRPYNEFVKFELC